jgi:hypothetical protein
MRNLFTVQISVIFVQIKKNVHKKHNTINSVSRQKKQVAKILHTISENCYDSFEPCHFFWSTSG